MTRDEAKALLGSTALLMFEHNGSSTLDGDKTLHIIDKIFDEHGEHLMDRDDEIELLKCRIEEAIKPKTCDGCSNLEDIGKSYKHCKELCINISHSTESTFYCNRYEAKVEI